MNRILMISTGGTLASSHSENGLAPGMSGNEILDRIETLTAGFQVDAEELFMLDSSNIQPEEWSGLAARIYERRADYDGVVVIHGTDTLAYTASALSFALQNIEIPVVLTGSQVSIENPIADATENCRAALHMAASRCPGVYVAFNRKIIMGTRASKVRTRSFDAFESIDYPYAARINSGGLVLNPRVVRVCGAPGEDSRCMPQAAASGEGGRYMPQADAHSAKGQALQPAPCILQNRFSTDVFLLKLFPGISPDIFTRLSQMGIRGVYVEAFGIGGLPFERRNITQAIRRAAAEGMVVAVGSQCLYEGSDFTVYEVGRQVLGSGVVETGNMTTEAAVTKLMWALGQYDEPSRVQEIMKTSLLGELGTAADWDA